MNKQQYRDYKHNAAKEAKRDASIHTHPKENIKNINCLFLSEKTRIKNNEDG